MARLIQPRPEPNSPTDLVAEVFKRNGFVDDAESLAAACCAVGLGPAEPHDDLDDEHEFVVEHVAQELRKLAPEGASSELVLLLSVHVLEKAARQGATSARGDVATLIAPAIGECALAEGLDLAEAVRAACARFKHGPAEFKSVIGALFTSGHLDPLRFLDLEAIRTTKKGTGGSWNQHARDNDPGLPDFWFGLDAVRALDAFRRLFEQEPIDTLSALALGLERAVSLQYPAMSTPPSPGAKEIRMRELYPHVDPLSRVLCRRRSESGRQDQVLTRCCWSYARLAGERAPEVLGDLYKPLADLALTELGDLRKALRSPDAESFLADQGAYLSEAVFFPLRTDAKSLWPVLRRLFLAFREVPRRGVPLDLRTWDEHEPTFEKIPRPWNWVADHIARVLELLIGRELEHDKDLIELRREFAKFCTDRIKTREKARPDRSLVNDDFFEPNPAWRAAYINAARELHPNLGERGHHVLTWSRDHDPDKEVQDAAREAAEVIRHGHGLPKNTSPRRAMFAAFWFLRQAHVVSLGGKLDQDGALRTFRKEMRRQADLEK